MPGRLQMKLETEFQAPISLTECVRRLESLQDKGLLLSTRIYIRRSDAQHAMFEINEWLALNFNATVSGDLIYHDNLATTVYAQATFNRKLFAVWMLVLLMLLVLLLTYIIRGDLLGLAFVLGGVVIILVSLRRLFWARRQLLTLVENMLQTVN